jgi:hypothetical protein
MIHANMPAHLIAALNPTRRPSSPIWPVAVLRNQSLQSHNAGRAKEIRSDGADLERVDEDAIGMASEEAVGLSHR